MDLKFFKKSIPTLAVMGIFSVIMIYAIYTMLTPEKKLPVFNPADVNPKLVDESLLHVRSNHKVADFKLINQNGDTITDITFGIRHHRLFQLCYFLSTKTRLKWQQEDDHIPQWVSGGFQIYNKTNFPCQYRWFKSTRNIGVTDISLHYSYYIMK